MMNVDREESIVMSTLKYTKDQQKAIDTIINKRPSYITCDRHLFCDKHNVVLSDTTLLVLQEPLWSTGKEFDVGRLIQSNESRDIETGFAVDPAATHSDCGHIYVKIGDNAYFDPTVLKRAFRAMKYRGEFITLHYTIDQRTQQRYCNCMTFRTDYGYALVMACRIKDESRLVEVLR